jgi:tRNA 2-thiouridine synthesizing protein A
MEENSMADRFEARDEWHAGDMGCGELVMVLRRKLRDMPGEVLKVIALDPAAPIDLAAWCRMTNNELLDADVANHSYWIRSRTTWS